LKQCNDDHPPVFFAHNNVKLREAKMERMFDALIRDDSLQDQHNVNSQSSGNVKKATVKLQLQG
jgi:hypothetical protein